MYLDDELISSPELDAGLANGAASTDIEVSGEEQSKEKAQEKVSKMDNTARVQSVTTFDDVYGWYLDDIMPLAHKVVRPASQQKKGGESV